MKEIHDKYTELQESLDSFADQYDADLVEVHESYSLPEEEVEFDENGVVENDDRNIYQFDMTWDEVVYREAVEKQQEVVEDFGSKSILSVTVLNESLNSFQLQIHIVKEI